MSGEIEKVDLVDNGGNIKMRKVPKNEIGQYPNLHLQIAVAVVFDESGRILAQRRALSKSTAAGEIDHVCGAVLSGELPDQTADREGWEETGLVPHDLSLVDKGVNSYDRFRYLFAGRADGEPKVQDSNEVEWVRFMTLAELRAKQQSGEFKFVNEFFDEVELVMNRRKYV
jgi:8-oxo-dGTP pyrophosphatase MutT (NUDIX family)